MRLTTKAVAGLLLPNGKAEMIVFDDSLPGFGLRIRAGGKRTWIVQYRLGRKQRRLTLGTPATLNADEARTLAKSKLAMAQLGSDPQLAKREARSAAALTFDKLASRYCEDYASARLSPGTLADVRRYLLRDLRMLSTLPVSTITRADVTSALGQVAGRSGPYAANRARAALSSLFSWGMAAGLVESNPVVGTRKAIDEKPRDRVLSDEELALIWHYADAGDYGTIVRLLILTGQRREEVAGMRWSEIDLRAQIWRISGDRTKNSRPHDVPLNPTAISLLEARQTRDARDLVFGSKGPFSGWSKAKKALDQRISGTHARLAATPQESLGARLPSWRLHDIRRTVVTRMADLGVLPHVIEAVVNHVSGHKAGVAGVYNRSTYAADKEAALLLWDRHLNVHVIRLALSGDLSNKTVN